MPHYYVYILYSQKSDTYYIGQTQDFESRLRTHNAGSVRSTKPYMPWIKILVLEKESRSEAVILEKKLKNLNRIRLLQFVEKYK